MRIGFIGLGTMGGRMASKLIEAGHTLVVYDIEPSAAAGLRERGAGWGESPADVARVSDIVLTSLPGPAEVEQVAIGDRGLAEGLRRGAVYVDLSTGSPSVVRAVAERIEAAGAHMIDAPVSGGPQGAEAGTLSVMAGGDREVFERVRPVLDTIGASVTYIGPIGAGTVAKLVHNAISMSTRIVLQEGLALAVKAGVDAATMLAVLRNASFGKQLVLTGPHTGPRAAGRLRSSAVQPRPLAQGRWPRAGAGPTGRSADGHGRACVRGDRARDGPRMG